MAAVGRVELLAWINALLQLNYTKIEQLGTGAAYCQVFDSIWGDLQMHKVKFDAKHEYEYVANFKVMQLALDQHKVDKAVPVERLVKCKFQDNLDFLQWLKQFHDMHFPGGYYDANARRHHKPPMLKSSKSSSSHSLTGSSSSRSVPAASRAPTSRAAPSSTLGTRKASVTNSRPGSAHGAAASTAAVQNLQRQVDDLTRVNEEQTAMITTLERERDFYYSKLRDIEILVQQEAARGQTSDLMTLIQQILYATDDGFEVPDEADAIGMEQDQGHPYGHDGMDPEFVDGDHMGHLQHHQHYEHGEYLDDEPMPAGSNGHHTDDMETF